MAQQRIAGLDALRGLAALGVFVCHFVAYWSFLQGPHAWVALSQVGAHGVDVFVVLSGFVLALPISSMGTRLNVRHFYGRRFWRILPVYWVAVLAAVILAVAPTWKLVVATPATPWDVFAYMIGLQTIFVPTLGTINGSLWSVSLELTLYLVLPIIALLLRRVGMLMLLLGTAALAVLADWVGSVAQLGGPLAGFIGDGHTLPMRLVQFVAGVCLARTLTRRDKEYLSPTPGNLRSAFLSSVVTAVIATLASTVRTPDATQMILWAVTGCAFVWLFALMARNALVRRLDIFGARTYSFYLIHQPVILLCGAAAKRLSAPRLVVGCLGAVLTFVVVAALAELLFRSIELPSHRIARQRFPSVVERHSDAAVGVST